MARLVLEGIVKHLGGKPVVNNLNLEVASGELISFLGASGCGKTTTLRLISGFLTADAGRILLDDKEIGHLPPERRPTAMVFQHYALWPHMRVFDNIAFGLQLRKLSKQAIRERVLNVLKLVDLEQYERVYPGQLSGGQQQRVALARALVLEPKLLLLDEPLSNLDAKLRVQLREEIRELQRRVGITTIFVTHDQDEAQSISDRVAVMEAGRLEQYAGPRLLYQEPETLYVAGFIGAMNMYRGAVKAQVIELEGASVPCLQAPAQVEGTVDIAVRPEDVVVNSEEGVSVEVYQRIPRGHYQEIVLDAPFGRLRAFSPNSVEIEDQTRVGFRQVLVYQDGKLVRKSKVLTQ